jgi:glutamate racemase
VKHPLLGIFDSGIGGLTVLQELHKRLPSLPLVYCADTLHMPYGSKGAEQIIAYSEATTRFLIAQGSTTVVAACGTASACAINPLRKNFELPLFGVLDALAKKTALTSKEGSIALLATSATIRSGALSQKIRSLRPDASLFELPCPLLAAFLEEKAFCKESVEEVVYYSLEPLIGRHFDTLVLGCTHYPLLKEVIQKQVGRNVALVDVSEAAVEMILPLFSPSTHHLPVPPKIFTSSASDSFRRICHRLFPESQSWPITELNWHEKKIINGQWSMTGQMGLK